MQKPFFAKRGLDLTGMHEATLNVELRSGKLHLKAPAHHFRQVEWTDLHPPEDFFFWPCVVRFSTKEYKGWVYHPSAATKHAHFQADAIIEILAPWISGLRYGDPVELAFSPTSAQLDTDTVDCRIVFPEYNG